MKKHLLALSVIFALAACGGSVTEPQANTNVAASQVSSASEAKPVEKAELAATLDMDWDTFRKRVNADFDSAGFELNIPDSIKPAGDGNSVRNVATLPFNDHLQTLVSEDPESKKLTGITVIMGFSSDQPMDNIKNVMAAALVLSSASGDDGNKKVGGKIIKMVNTSLDAFEKQLKKEDMPTVKDKFVVGDVKYGILISKALGSVMLFAEPEKAEDK